MFNLGPYNDFLQGVYVDLDSLFDTRFAVLEQVDPVLALHNLKNGWNTRVQDVFEGIDKKLFDELYKTRDNSVLAMAPATQIIDAVKTWVTKALETINGSPNGDKVVIFVNVWPYNITKVHAREIGNSVHRLVGQTVDIRMINIDPEKICTKTAKAYFSAMFMYDWDYWLEANTKNASFEKQRIPDVTLYAPKVYKQGEPSKEELAMIAKSKANMFEQFEMMAGPQVGIEFIDIAFYSNHMPSDYIDHYEDMRKALRNTDL